MLTLDSAGTFLWAGSMGGLGRDEASSLAVDSAGAVYATGYFGQSADFDPGVQTSILTSAGINDVFLVRLTNTGDFVWAKATGAGGLDRGTGLALSGGNRLHVVGFFEGTVDFNPGVGAYPLASAGDKDMFHQILDTAGNFIAASRTGGSGGDYADAVVVDSAGAVYTTGTFDGSVDFDPSPANSLLSSPGMATSGFIRKLSAGSVFEWAYKIAFLSKDIALGRRATVHCTGSLSQTFQFDPPVGPSVTPAGGGDAFVIKINQDDPTRVVSMPTDAGEPYILSPNPSRGTVTLRSTNGFLRKAQVHLLDATGRTLGAWLSKEDNAFELDVQPFATGLYWIEVVRADGAVSITRLVKQ